MKDFSNQVVIITGGSKGIGRETAKRFAAMNATVIITGRRKEELEKTAALIRSDGGLCDYFQGDVTQITDCQQIIEAVRKKYHHIDVLVNNAGMSMRGLFADTELDVFHQIMDINFSGAVNMTKLALSSLKASRGSVVFISSLSGLKGIPGIAPYCAAKMALTAFSESLRAELHPDHVHVGILYVGFTENDPDKTIYTATGERMILKRDQNNDTQDGVAKRVIHVVRKRKPRMVLTPLGKITAVMVRFFPRLTGFVLRKFAMKSGRYQP